MIFRDTHEQVLDGTKTQTRRLVKDGDILTIDISDPRIFSRAWVNDSNGRMRWKEGRTYAVQAGRGKRGLSLGRIRILSIRQERLQDISVVDCYAEGVVEAVEFPCDGVDGVDGYEGSGNINIREYFGKMWDSIHPKGKRWSDNPEVWVLEFELVEGEAGREMDRGVGSTSLN